MATSINAPDKKRLKRAQQQAAEAAAEALRRQNRVRDLLIEDQADKDKEIRTIRAELRKRREVLHRHRLLIGRKKFSVRIQSKKLEHIQATLKKLEEQEIILAKNLEELVQKEITAKDRLATQLAPPETPQRA
jgi:GTPase involved in cell partitioning and DNA repair